MYVVFVSIYFQSPEYQNEERIFWHWWDPMLIAECFFCVAILLAFYKILYPFKISQVFNLCIQMENCKTQLIHVVITELIQKDIVKFLVIPF